MELNLTLTASTIQTLTTNNNTLTTNNNTFPSTTGQVVDIPDAICVFVFGIIGGTVGNILLLLVIGCNKKLRTIPNTYMISIAISDLLITAEAFPVIFANNVNRRNVLAFGGMDDTIFCQIQCSIHGLSVTVSLYSIMFVAINRYLCVCKSACYRSHIGMKSSIITNIVIWVVCLALAFVLFAFQVVKAEYNPYLTACVLRHHGGVLYAYVRLLGIFVPLFITLVCYIMIYKTVHETGKRMRQHEQTKGSPQKQLSRKDLTVIRVLFFTYAAFGICWIPYSIIAIVVLHRGPVPPLAYKITARMCIFNACANSVVFGLFNPEFRRKYKRFLCLPVQAIIQKKLVIVEPEQSQASSSKSTDKPMVSTRL